MQQQQIYCQLSSITFEGPEHKSWTGWEDGRKKNENTIFKGPTFAAQKHLFLDFFENFQSRRFWLANFTMKTAPRVYHDEGHGKCKKTVISDFLIYITFVTEIFHFKVHHFSFFWKFLKMRLLTILAATLRVLPKHLDQN